MDKNKKMNQEQKQRMEYQHTPSNEYQHTPSNEYQNNHRGYQNAPPNYQNTPPKYQTPPGAYQYQNPHNGSPGNHPSDMTNDQPSPRGVQTEYFTQQKPTNQINDIIKNDRFVDPSNVDIKETPYPIINSVNNVDIHKTDPIDLINMKNTPDKKELTYDEIEQQRNQQDQDIKNNLNNEETVLHATNYNNKKDNRPFNKQVNNIDMIKNEMKQENELYESQLDGGSLNNDSLSFSFI